MNGGPAREQPGDSGSRAASAPTALLAAGAAAIRRAARRVVWETEYAILTRYLARHPDRSISAMIRVKDEEEFLYPAVKSIAAHVDEIIIVDNLSTDRTPSIIGTLRREYPHKILSYHYPYEIRRRGSENRESARQRGARFSPHLSANYYNWCLKRCRRPFVLKWDGDMISTDAFAAGLEAWRASPQLVMMFKGVNVHPDRRHLIAARSRDLDRVSSEPAGPSVPKWIASMSHTAVEPRLFPRLFARYRMEHWTQSLAGPCQRARRGSESWYALEEAGFLHLKFCKCAPYADFSPDLERIISSNVTVGPLLRAAWGKVLERWGLGPQG